MSDGAEVVREEGAEIPGAPEEGAGPVLSLNKMFNDLPIRVVGSYEAPCFYAKDIADALNITNVSRVVGRFRAHEIVGPELRERLGIRTYRSDGRPNPGIILLTEAGLYRMIYQSRGPLADAFSEYAGELLREVRLRDPDAEAAARLRSKIALLEAAARDWDESAGSVEFAASELAGLELERRERQELLGRFEAIEVFEIPNDPRASQQAGVFHEEDRGYAGEEAGGDPAAAFLAMCREDYGEDIPEDLLEQAEEMRAEAAALQEDDEVDDPEAFYEAHPQWRPPPNSYKLTQAPTALDRTRYRRKMVVYTKDAAGVLARVEDRLGHARPDCAELETRLYSCEWWELRAAIKGSILVLEGSSTPE